MRSLGLSLSAGTVVRAEQEAQDIVATAEYLDSFETVINGTNPAYSTTAYKKSGYTPDGFLLKVVYTEQA